MATLNKLSIKVFIGNLRYKAWPILFHKHNRPKMIFLRKNIHENSNPVQTNENNKDQLYFFHPGFREENKGPFKSSFEITRNFIKDEDETNLMDEVEPHLKRLVYEKDHWDEVN